MTRFNRLLCFFLGHKWMMNESTPTPFVRTVRNLRDMMLRVTCSRCGIKGEDA
jgi:hypothetical protein